MRYARTKAERERGWGLQNMKDVGLLDGRRSTRRPPTVMILSYLTGLPYGTGAGIPDLSPSRTKHSSLEPQVPRTGQYLLPCTSTENLRNNLRRDKIERLDLCADLLLRGISLLGKWVILHLVAVVDRFMALQWVASRCQRCLLTWPWRQSPTVVRLRPIMRQRQRRRRRSTKRRRPKGLHFSLRRLISRTRKWRQRFAPSRMPRKITRTRKGKLLLKQQTQASVLRGWHKRRLSGKRRNARFERFARWQRRSVKKLSD